MEFNDVAFAYEPHNPVFEGLSFHVHPGQWVAITGPNGCGKSSAARLMNALSLPTAGTVTVCGMRTNVAENTYPIRKACGLVFQNPDNQITSTLVHENVAFGPQNLGLPAEEVGKRVQESLAVVGLSDITDQDVNTLSGGQKQLVAIAGALAMHPRILVLDEATSMLDNAAADDVLRVVRALHKTGITVVMITHDDRLAALAERVIALAPMPIVNEEPIKAVSPPADAPSIIQLDHVSYSYAQGNAPVLEDLTVSIRQGAFAVITGANGSGKSTLLNLISGLDAAQSGTITVCGHNLSERGARDTLRQHYGYAFQFAEQQLFQRTVYDEVAYTLRHLGANETEVQQRVREAFALVGLPFQAFYARNPFTLSGGEQKKVALAAALAHQPQLLLLDEPCTGLDAPSRALFLRLLCELNAAGTTIVMVSHDERDAQIPNCENIALR